MDVVLFGEFGGEGTPKRIQVCDCVLAGLGAGCAAEEEGLFGVFDGFWGFFVEGAFGAGVAGFSIRKKG